MKEPHLIEPNLMAELSDIESSVDEGELGEMLKEVSQAELEENSRLVNDSQGKKEVIRWWNRLHVASFVLKKLLQTKEITVNTSFNRVTGILDTMHQDLKDEDNSSNPPEDDSNIRPGHNTSYVMVCLNVLDEIQRDNLNLGFDGQTPIGKFIDFINLEILQLEEATAEIKKNKK